MSKAWSVMNNVVRPRMEQIGLDKEMKPIHGTIYSKLDWNDGVAMLTPRGIIHVLGTGEIVDEENLLKYK